MIRENSEPRVDKEQTAIATGASPTAVEWPDGSTSIDYRHFIVGTVYFLETGGAQSFTYQILQEGVIVKTATVAASGTAHYVLTALSDDLVIKLVNGSGAATVTVKVKAK